MDSCSVVGSAPRRAPFPRQIRQPVAQVEWRGSAARSAEMPKKSHGSLPSGLGELVKLQNSGILTADPRVCPAALPVPEHLHDNAQTCEVRLLALQRRLKSVQSINLEGAELQKALELRALALRKSSFKKGVQLLNFSE